MFCVPNLLTGAETLFVEKPKLCQWLNDIKSHLHTSNESESLGEMCVCAILSFVGWGRVGEARFNWLITGDWACC